MAVRFGPSERVRNMKRTSQGIKKRRIKWASMNKDKKRSFKIYRGQGR